MCSASDLGKLFQNDVSSCQKLFCFWSGRWQCCVGLRHVFARYIKEASERICTCLKKETNAQNIGNLWVPCKGQGHQKDKHLSVIKVATARTGLCPVPASAAAGHLQASNGVMRTEGFHQKCIPSSRGGVMCDLR